MNYVVKKMDDYVVAQHNALIEANYPAGLSVRANKIIRLIFSLIKPNEENLREHTIGIKTVKKYLGYNLFLFRYKIMGFIAECKQIVIRKKKCF